MSAVALGRWSRADSVKDGDAASNRPQSSAATFAARTNMTVSLCLFSEAPTAVRTLDDSNITGGVEEAIAITKAVALEEGQI